MELLAWGANSYGQLGFGHKCEQVLVPSPVTLPEEEDLQPKNIDSIAAGAGHTIILTKNGALFACGWNSKGQLGLETETLVFTQIKALKTHKIVQIACGWDFSAAISSENKLFVWGSNAFKQIGLPKHLKHTSNPTLLDNLLAKHVSCGLRHMAIVTTDGKIMICGNGNKGQLGLLDKSENSLRESDLKTIPDIHDIVSVSCGQFHTLALKSDGSILSWGNNKHGQLGFDPNTYPQILIPTKIDLNVNPREIHTGWTHSAILTKSGEVFNFGRNCYGQLGCERVKFWEPTKLDCEKLIKLSVGSEHNLAITTNDKLLCWGWNEHGNCGTGDTDDVKFPKKNLDGILHITTGTGQSFAIVKKC